jgi:hypothetical protein
VLHVRKSAFGARLHASRAVEKRRRQRVDAAQRIVERSDRGKGTRQRRMAMGKGSNQPNSWGGEGSELLDLRIVKEEDEEPIREAKVIKQSFYPPRAFGGSGIVTVEQCEAASAEQFVATRSRRTKRLMKKQAEEIGKLNLLETIHMTEQVNLIGEEWVELNTAVDSGATESVVSRDDAINVPAFPGVSSRAGVKHAMANNETIENEGEKKMQVSFAEGMERLLTAQVTEVSKPLLSVSQMVKMGHTVVFSPSGSWICEQECGESMELQERACTCSRCR